jgi:hypothetical protein
MKEMVPRSVSTRCSTGSYLLRDRKVHRHGYKIRPITLILSQLNRLHIFTLSVLRDSSERISMKYCNGVYIERINLFLGLID